MITENADLHSFEPGINLDILFAKTLSALSKPIIAWI